MARSGAQRIVTFEGESKHAITPDFPSSLGFEATLPSEPFLEFAIAVDAPRDLSRGQVRFTVRLRADTKTFVVFDEVVRARRGPRWHDRRINLAAWRDRDVELVLEARPADPSAVGAWADRVRIAWGDPVVSNHGLDTVARPSVVFVLVDTLRRDHLGVYGFAGGISPNIDGLAKESVLFDNAFSQAPWTKPSIATLFTSVHPDVHGLDNHGGLFGERNNELLTTGVLSSETVTMAEVFQSEGYRTAAFVANPWLDAPFGFDQGFGRYEILRDGNIILQEARDWLETTDGEPFFLYLHFMDVHSPYDAPEDDFEEMRESSSLEVTQSPPRDVLERLPPYLDGISWFGPEDLAASGWGGIIDHRLGRSRTLRARYAANVRAFDRLIGPFLQQIRNSELGRTAYVVLTSDHGEELLEHGGWDHGFNLYDHQIRVPLLIRAPGARFAGRRVRRGIGLIDLLPTLTALAGLEAPKDVQGRAQLLERDDLSDFASFATATKHRQGVYSVRTGRFKLLVDVASRTVSLFDLASDPLEYTDIAEERPEVAEELGRFLTSYLEENAGIPALAPELAPIRDELKQKLEALGYLSR